MIKRAVRLFAYLLCLVLANHSFASLPQDLINKKLTIAVELRDIKHIEALVSKGAIVTFSHIQSAIHAKADSHVLALLLSNLKMPYDPAIFHQHLRFAIEEKSVETFDKIYALLLKHEPSFAIQDDLLLLAAKKGSLTTFTRLQKRGASLNALTQDNDTECLLNHAIAGGNSNLITMFLEAGFKPVKVCNGSLTLAIQQNNVALVQQLLKEGAVVNGDIKQEGTGL